MNGFIDPMAAGSPYPFDPPPGEGHRLSSTAGLRRNGHPVTVPYEWRDTDRQPDVRYRLAAIRDRLARKYGITVTEYKMLLRAHEGAGKKMPGHPPR